MDNDRIKMLDKRRKKRELLKIRCKQGWEATEWWLRSFTLFRRQAFYGRNKCVQLQTQRQ